MINNHIVKVSLDNSDQTNDVAGGTLSTPPLAALDEMRVTTYGYKADQNSDGSATIQLNTRAGTNTWRGTAMITNRGDQFSALPATIERRDSAPSFGRSQYSGSIGGPIVRDKVFWFGSFEYLRQHSLLQSGERDLDARAIQNKLSAVPLASSLGLFRADWNVSDRDQVSMVYSAERSDGDDLPVLQRPLASSSQRRHFNEEFDQGLIRYTRNISPTLVAETRIGFSGLRASNVAINEGIQLNFPNLQTGAPFLAPALPRNNRWQMASDFSKIQGRHTFKFGAETQHINAEYALGFGQGAIEYAENFASVDRNGDNRLNDDDLLIAITLRNISPQRRNAYLRNTRFTAFGQDDWLISPRLSLNLGVRWEIDTNEKNISGYADINPLVRPFLRGDRARDKNNFAPRLGFAWSRNGDRLVVRGGYAMLYDRILLQYSALEQSLDGRHTAIGAFAGASVVWPNMPGINILDNALRNPMFQQANLEVESMITKDLIVRAGYHHSFGSGIMLGRRIGEVLNPLTGAFDRVVNLESSAKSKYDALNLSVQRRISGRSQLLANYTLSKAFNYDNGGGGQLFFTGQPDPNKPGLEYGPAPMDRRHRFSLSGDYEFRFDLRAAIIWTLASGTPMDILLPDASGRPPLLQRNTGGRLFHTPSDLNRFPISLNNAGGVNGTPLPLATANARFNDRFQSFDLRLTKIFKLRGDAKLELGGEIFNLFNITNILGWSNNSGYANALSRDSQNPDDPGFYRSSGFGRPLTTAGRLYTAGGPRSVQFIAKFSF